MKFFADEALREGIHGLPSLGPHIRSSALFPMDRHLAIQREMEKQRIREEIIEAKIFRRHMLVEEVRRELMFERHMTLQEELKSVFEKNMALQEELKSIHPSSMVSNDRGQDLQPETRSLEKRLEGLESMPFQRSSKPLILEAKPPSVVTEGKAITMDKPILHLSGLKRKADTPLEMASTDGLLPIPAASSKKMRSFKSVWSCSLCQISATSERGLKDHLNGKKHKAKELKLRKNNDEKKQDPLEEGGLKDHLNGKKHKSKELKLRRNNNEENKQDPLEEGEVETFLETKSMSKKEEEDYAVKKKALEGQIETLLETKSMSKKEEDYVVKKNVENNEVGEIKVEMKEDKNDVELKEGEVETSLETKADCLPKKKEQYYVEVGNNEVGEMEEKNDDELKTMKTKKSNHLMHWCEICNVGTPVRKLMRCHKMGKKHLKNVKLLGGEESLLQVSKQILPDNRES